MRTSSRLPARFQVGTKYVLELEGSGPFVRRYIEFASGRRVQCAKREQISIAPDQTAGVIDALEFSRRIFA